MSTIQPVKKKSVKLIGTAEGMEFNPLHDSNTLVVKKGVDKKIIANDTEETKSLETVLKEVKELESQVQTLKKEQEKMLQEKKENEEKKHLQEYFEKFDVGSAEIIYWYYNQDKNALSPGQKEKYKSHFMKAFVTKSIEYMTLFGAIYMIIYIYMFRIPNEDCMFDFETKKWVTDYSLSYESFPYWDYEDVSNDWLLVQKFYNNSENMNVSIKKSSL